MEAQTNFTNNDKAIADYILSHREAVLDMNAEELGKASYTSAAAVIRFCKNMGLKGYREFHIRYARELEQDLQKTVDINPNFPFEMDDSAAIIASKLKSLIVQSVSETYNTLLSDKPELEKAVSLLLMAKKVGIFGAGDAYIAGLAFQAQMMRAGFNYFCTPVYGEQGHLAQTFDEHDAALLLSYSGTTPKTNEAAIQLRKQNTPVIAITSNPDSELFKIAQIRLLLPDAEQKFHRLGNFSSQASLSYVLNVIYSIIYVRSYDIRKKGTID